MSAFIGRLLNVGLGKESTRGTAVAATAWMPKTDFAVEAKVDVAVIDQSIGIIEDATTQEVVKKYATLDISGVASDIRLGMLLMAAFGTDTVGAVETGVKDHVFTILESAQHPSYTIAVSEPNAQTSASLNYVLAMLSSLEINVAVGQFATFKASYTANIGTPASATPSFGAENTFNPLYCTVQVAPTYTGIAGTLTATGTAASTVNVTACSINPQTNLRVGMGVTGTNVPAGTTIAAIVSSTAFTLSAATTGAVGTMTFTPATINTRSAKIVIKKNTEDDPTIGNLSPIDRYNNQFVVEGEMVLVYQDRSWIDTYMVGDTLTGMRILLKNTGVTIGTTSNPTLTIDLAKVKITEVARSNKNDDIMMQTIKFKAFYSTTDTLMIKATLRNTQTTTY